MNLLALLKTLNEKWTSTFSISGGRESKYVRTFYTYYNKIYLDECSVGLISLIYFAF